MAVDPKKVKALPASIEEKSYDETLREICRKAKAERRWWSDAAPGPDREIGARVVAAIKEKELEIACDLIWQNISRLTPETLKLLARLLLHAVKEGLPSKVYWTLDRLLEARPHGLMKRPGALVRARAFQLANPKATERKIAEEAGVSRPLVQKWIKDELLDPTPRSKRRRILDTTRL